MTVLALDKFTDAPTGPMCRILDAMRAGKTLAAFRDAGKLRAAIAGTPVLPSVLAGMVSRGLVEPTDGGDDRTEYRLTAAGVVTKR